MCKKIHFTYLTATTFLIPNLLFLLLTSSFALSQSLKMHPTNWGSKMIPWVIFVRQTLVSQPRCPLHPFFSEGLPPPGIAALQAGPESTLLLDPRTLSHSLHILHPSFYLSWRQWMGDLAITFSPHFICSVCTWESCSSLSTPNCLHSPKGLGLWKRKPQWLMLCSCFIPGLNASARQWSLGPTGLLEWEKWGVGEI